MDGVLAITGNRLAGTFSRQAPFKAAAHLTNRQATVSDISVKRAIFTGFSQRLCTRIQAMIVHACPFSKQLNLKQWRLRAIFTENARIEQALALI